MKNQLFALGAAAEQLDAVKRKLETTTDKILPRPAPARPATAVAKLTETVARLPKTLVVGGDMRWKPIDRVAARLVAKAPWWAKPPEEVKPVTVQQNNQRNKTMKHEYATVERPVYNHETYVNKSGVKITMNNGVLSLDEDDMRRWLSAEAVKLPGETRPMVQAAEDAKKVVNEMLDGVSAGMEKFRTDAKRYLEEIRQVRFAVVTEAAQMSTPLKDVRQFFLGGDYKEEVARLREFVDLCERLHKLKESGFLDKVADTMLALAVKR